jgi:hypothetical protein
MVQLTLANSVAQRRLGGLDRSCHPIFDRGHYVHRRIGPKPEDGVDLHSDTVAGDRFLRFELIGDGPHVDPDHAVNEGDQPVPARPLHRAEPAKPK